MEQHPVPQDIKSFQFKLVGDMTLRQFAFLAGGLIIAYLAFILPLHFLIKWPIILLSSSLGIGCAFFPINERPLDQWIVAFFKAIFSPTQRVWRKTPQPLLLSLPSVSKKLEPQKIIKEEKKLEKYLASLPTKKEEPLEEEKKFLAKIQPFLTPGEEKTLPAEEKSFRPSVAPQTIPLVQPVLKIQNHQAKPKVVPLSQARIRKLGKPKPLLRVVPEEPKQPKEIFEKTPEITEMAKEEIEKAKSLEEYKKEIERLRAEKERLLKEALMKKEEARKAKEAIARLKKQPPPPKKTPPKPPPPKPPVFEPIKKRVLPKIVDQPNIINGVVADQKGNLLEGVIVIIKDKDGTPVRALKTNSLGQFATATPLPNGVYSIEAEKEGYKFDIIYQEIKGGVLPPLEIRAR